MFGFAILGFLCGYFGPLYLVADPGVGPLTALVSTPLGAVIGGAIAVHGSVGGLSSRRYFVRLLGAAAVFAGAVLVLVLVQ